MFSPEIRKLLAEVISSWQVWAVAAVIVLYIFLVNFVARVYHRPRSQGSRKPFLPKPKSKPEIPETPSAPTDDSDSEEPEPDEDELGLEEETPPAKNRKKR